MAAWKGLARAIWASRMATGERICPAAFAQTVEAACPKSLIAPVGGCGTLEGGRLGPDGPEGTLGWVHFCRPWVGSLGGAVVIAYVAIPKAPPTTAPTRAPMAVCSRSLSRVVLPPANADAKPMAAPFTAPSIAPAASADAHPAPALMPSAPTIAAPPKA